MISRFYWNIFLHLKQIFVVDCVIDEHTINEYSISRFYSYCLFNFKKVFELIAWLRNTWRMNNSYKDFIQIFFGHFEVKVSSSLHDRRTQGKLIIDKKILLNYFVELEGQISRWLYDQQSNDKWIILPRFQVDSMLNSTNRFLVHYMIDHHMRNE